jgi:hypothetical protein
VSNPPEEPNPIAGRPYAAIGGSADVAGKTAAQVAGLTTALTSLSAAMAKMQQQASTFSSAVGGMFSKLGSGAQNAASAVTSVGASLGSIGSAMFGSANEKGWVKDFMMFPTRFMRGNVTENRQLALSASAGLGPLAFGAGVGTQGMMTNITGLMASQNLARAGQLGILGGSPNDLLNLVNIASRVGAGINWRNPGGLGNAPRSAGFLQAVAQAQRMNPGESVGTLATQIGGYTGNVGAQQQAAFLTGGAFSMIAAGNRQKSISEWAEGILKWLANLRAGGNKGKAFNYGELMSQNFPGSNIDAWLTVNGVTDDMKMYFWSYAMAKSNAAPGATADQLFTKNEAVDQSVAFNRLQATSAQTRTGFQLAGTMAGAYANKEQANRWMNELLGHMMNQVLPAAMSTGALSYMQYLPDQVEEIMMQLAERTNLGTLGAGVVGWGSAIPGLGDVGDVGDVGDFGKYGGTTTAGLHPDMRRRLDAMMAANPRLRVTSGFRDLGTQQRLKRQGVGRVSGRPSAHTRGMAADMGPRDQYPWIVANARKFGLRSGMNAGEPWHVGMGDIPDVGQTEGLGALQIPGLIAQGEEMLKMSGIEGITTMFQGLFKGMLAGATGAFASPEDQIKGIGSSISTLLRGMLGLFGGELKPGRLDYRNVYEQLVAASNATPVAGLPTGTTTAGGTNWWSDIFKRAATGVTGAVGGGGGAGPQGLAGPSAGGGTLDAFFREVLTGLGAPVTQTNLNKLAAVTKFEGNGSSFNPFNSTGGDFPNKKNSVGVENYPDWGTGVQYTVKLLNQNNTAGMRGNLMAPGSYADWLNKTSAFYHSWGGPSIPNIAESAAQNYLSTPIKGAGDLLEDNIAGPMMMPAPRQAPMIFNNTFTIQGGSGGNGGIDMRRTVQVLADQLQDEMKRRMARAN